MNKSLKNSYGLAQIPLMIILLLMAIAVPVATKLVQQNAENRSDAKSTAPARLTYDEKRANEEVVRQARRDGAEIKNGEIVVTSAPNVVVNTTPKVATAPIPATGCTADNQCSGECAYCGGGGRCVSGCTVGSAYTAPLGQKGPVAPVVALVQENVKTASGMSLYTVDDTKFGCKITEFWDGDSCVVRSIVNPVTPLKSGVVQAEYDNCLKAAQAPGTTDAERINYCNDIYATSIHSGQTVAHTAITSIESLYNVDDTKFGCKITEFWDGDRCLVRSTVNPVAPLKPGVSQAEYDNCLKAAQAPGTTDAERINYCNDIYAYVGPITLGRNTILPVSSDSSASPAGSASSNTSSGANSTTAAKKSGSSASTNSSGCVEQCPNTKDKTLLYTCNPPESDGTPDIKGCGWANSMCGGSCYTCAAGGTWQPADNSKCGCTTAMPPTNLKVTCNGSIATATWDASSCADSYDIGADDTINPWVNDCDALNPGDFCQKGLTTTSFSRETNPERSYRWGLQSNKGTSVSTQVFGETFTCGSAPVLNYKIAFGGVIPSSSQCVIDWPLQFIVMSGGESKVYTNVLHDTETVVNGKLVFGGSLKLTGFTKTSNVAVFIKNSKSLQMKYGINNQSGPYNKAGGELSLTSDLTTSPTYDFTAFPLLPGDVVGIESLIQDSFVNGFDFSYVKSKSLSHELVNAGGYLAGDLDGNCQVNSNDVNLLKITLQEKQGQLY